MAMSARTKRLVIDLLMRKQICQRLTDAEREEARLTDRYHKTY